MLTKFQILMVVQVLLSFVQGRLKESGQCNFEFEDEIHSKFQCRKSCRGVIESPAGKCDDELKCCHLIKPIVKLELPEYGYCVLDKVIDEQFECRKSCDDLVEISMGKCAIGLKCCFTISPNYGKEVTTASEVFVEKVTTFSERVASLNNGISYQPNVPIEKS